MAVAFCTKGFDNAVTHDPSPDLALARKYAQRDIAEGELWFGAFKSCDTKLDRSGERFTKRYLERFAETLPGKPVLIGHDVTKQAVGRLYGAEVLPDGDHWYLKSHYFMRADNPLVKDIELGIQRACSIGFNAGKRVCSIDGKSWLPHRLGDCKEHQPLKTYDGQLCTLTYCDSEAEKAEGMEMSLVWVGCQPGAEAIPKGLLAWGMGIDPESVQSKLWSLGFYGAKPAPEESGMELKEALAEVERLKGLTVTSEREKALEAKLAELETKAGDGDKYRAFLISDTQRMADTLDVMAGDENKSRRKQWDALVGALKDASIEVLENLRAPTVAEFNQKCSNGTGQVGGAADPPPANVNTKSELLERFAGGLL